MNLALVAATLLLATSSAIVWQWRRAESHLADARRHREQRDAQAAEAASSKEEAATSKEEAATSKEEAATSVSKANGQLLSVALTAHLSQDTRAESVERRFFQPVDDGGCRV